MGHLFETQQIVLLSTGAPLRDEINGNKSYILSLRHHFETKSTITKPYILPLGHHYETQATAANRTS